MENSSLEAKSEAVTLVKAVGKILVMDDSEQIRTLTKVMLTKLGFDVGHLR